MRIFQTYRGLPKSVYVIFAAQVINRFGDFVMPFLTLFLTIKLGYSVALTGTIVMASSLMTIPGGLSGGKIADHFGRVKTYVLFQGMAGLTILLCTFLSQTSWFIPLILLSSFFNGGVRPIIGAILTDVLSEDQRQAGFSLSYLGINVGVALGPIVAGFLFNHYLSWIFIGDALTSLLAIALVAYFIPESLPSREGQGEAHTDGPAPKEESTIRILMAQPVLLLFFCFSALYSATYVQSHFSLPILLGDLYGAKGPEIFGSITSVNAITVLLMTVVITNFSKRFTPILNIAIGGLAYALGFGIIGMLHQLPLFVINTFFWTLGEIIISTNYGVYIANKSPVNHRARISAVSSVSWAVGALIGTAVIGVIVDHFGLQIVWPIVGVLSLLGSIGMVGIWRFEKGLKKG